MNVLDGMPQLIKGTGETEPALTDEQVAACLRLREVMAG